MRRTHRSTRRRGPTVAALALFATAPAVNAHAGDNPGYDRPGLGFAAAALPAGAVTLEQGLPDWSRTDGASLFTADTLLRVGMGGPFELQLGTSYNRLSATGQHASGRGDAVSG